MPGRVRKTPLRAVEVGESAAAKPLKPKPMSVREAADSGNRRALLAALQARISSDIDNVNTPSRDLAALSRRLLEIAKEIEAIDAHDQGDEVGDAAATPDEEWIAT